MHCSEEMNIHRIKSQYNTISVSEASIKEQYTYVYNSYESLRQQVFNCSVGCLWVCSC